jgi:hypothetical protein
MKLSTVIFGGTEERPVHYHVTDPPATWRRLPGEAAECIQCRQTLTFCFVDRTDETKAGFGTTYMSPVAVRCDCFLDGPQLEKMQYHRILKREPVKITPADDYLHRLALADEMRKACDEALALPQPEPDAEYGEETK